MSRDVDALLLSMAADLRSMKREMTDGADHFDRTTRRMEKRQKELEKKFEQLGAGLGEGIKKASLVASVAFGAIIGYSVKVAASAVEMKNAFQVAFGTGADEAEKFAEALSKKVGRSQLDIMESMTRFRLLFKDQASGIGEDLTKALQERAIDVGSLFNIKDDEVVQKFFSAITGESEPVKALGVNLNEAAVKAELLRLGFKGNAEQAPETAKQIARANLLLRQTEVAAGDAAKTIDSTANSFKKLQGEVKDSAAKFGEQFLPIADKVLHWATDALEAFNKLPEGMQLAGLAAIGLVAASGPLTKLALGIKKIIDLAIEARAAMIAMAAVAPAAGAAGAAGGAAGGAAAAVAGGGAAAAGVTTLGVGMILATPFIPHDAVKKFNRAVKSPGQASDQDLTTAIAYAAAKVDQLSRERQPAGRELLQSLQSDLTRLKAEAAKRTPAKPPGAALAAAAAPGQFSLTDDQKKPIAAGAGGKKGAAKSKAERDAEAAERLRLSQDDRFNAAIGRANDDLLAVREKQADSADERLQLELQAIENERVSRRADLALAVEKKELTSAQAILVDMAEESVRSARAKAASDRAAEDNARSLFVLKAEQLETEIELAELAAGLAVTSKDRRAAELRILDLTTRLEKARLEEVLRSERSSPDDKALARQRLAALPAVEAAQKDVIKDRTRSAIDEFVEANTNVDRLRENIERLSVRSFDQLADSLAEAAVSAEDLGDVAKNVFRQMIAELLSMEIKKGGIALAGALHIPGFAGGTNYAPSGYAIVGENGPELVRFRQPGAQITSTGGLRAALASKVDRSGSMQTIVQQFHLHAEGAVMTPELMAGLNAQARDYATRAAKVAVGASLQAMPGRLQQLQRLGAG